MKTNVILFLATLLFATSCSNKFSLVKRKYNKGFYVSVNKKAVAPKPVERNDVKQNTAVDKVAVQVVPANNNTSYVPVTNVKPAAVVSDKSAPKSTGSKHDHITTVVTAAANDQVSFEPAKTIKTVPAANKMQVSDSEVNLVLLVILAILIPPLAVYLKHKTIDMWFWITLILTVLAYGLFFGSFSLGGLFGLAAVVIALLYVFDVING